MDLGVRVFCWCVLLVVWGWELEKSCCQEILAWDLGWIVGGVFRVKLDVLSCFVYYVLGSLLFSVIL